MRKTSSLNSKLAAIFLSLCFILSESISYAAPVSSSNVGAQFIAPSKGRDESRPYPSISLLLSAEDSQDQAILEKVKAIDSKTLFQEINSLEDDVANRFLSSKRNRRIFHYHKSLELLNKVERH